MESRFRHDFSHVRLHTDARAVESANALSARAYAVGHHITFAAGQYRPHTRDGRRLLAHELTHTLQQRPQTSPRATNQWADDNTGGTQQRFLAHSQSHLAIHTTPTLFPALQRQTTSAVDPTVPDKKTPLTASELLAIFTQHRELFKHTGPSIFQSESHDKDAVSQSIQVKEGGIYWNFKFVTNSKTGVTYVHQNQNGTEVHNYYQGIVTNQSAAAVVPETNSDNKNIPTKGESKTTVAEDAPEGAKKAVTHDVSPSSVDTPAKKASRTRGSKIDKIVLTSGTWIGGQDQTWLPGTDHHGKPIQQGDLTRDLETELLTLTKRIKASVSLPKELRISVSLFRTHLPTPGYKYAAENAGLNIKTFLESHLPKSIKVTEVHQFVDTGFTGGSVQQLYTITPIY